MSLKLSLDSNKIYHKEFEGTKPGYDALQVDSFLDIVIKDYETMESYVAETDDNLHALNAKIKLLNEELSKAESENVSLKTKLNGIAPDQNVSMNNLELIRRISELEKALKKAGINPNTIR